MNTYYPQIPGTYTPAEIAATAQTQAARERIEHRLTSRGDELPEESETRRQARRLAGLPPITSAREVAETYGRAMGASSAHATVERVWQAPDGSRQVETVGEATWTSDRETVNQRVRDVFHQARERRWESGQIQDPAVRDALSLT